MSGDAGPGTTVAPVISPIWPRKPAIRASIRDASVGPDDVWTTRKLSPSRRGVTGTVGALDTIGPFDTVGGFDTGATGVGAMTAGVWAGVFGQDRAGRPITQCRQRRVNRLPGKVMESGKVAAPDACPDAWGRGGAGRGRPGQRMSRDR